MSSTIEQLRERHGARYKWLVLFTLMTGSVAGVVSSTIINVAIPDLSRYFGVGQERIQWVTTGFMLAMTLAMLVTPWLLQRFGLRRLYGATVLMLLAGGLLGGLSVNFPMLLAMRVVSGLAAGIIQPLAAIIVLRAFEPELQGRAMGVFGFGVVLAPAVGPSLGGYLVQLFGWRSIFFAVVPVALVALEMTRRYLAVNSPFVGERRPLDWLGLLLIGGGTLCLLNGLIHWRDARSEAMLLIGFGLLGILAFIAWQRKCATPLLNMKLFSYRQFSIGAVVAFIYGVGLFGSTYLLPIYMQIGLGFSPADSGLALLPAGLVLAVTIWVAGRMTGRWPAHAMVAGGQALLALSLVLVASGSPATTLLAVAAWTAIGRLGLGLILPALGVGGIRGIDYSLIPQASSASNFLRQLGGAIGVSLSGIMLEWRLTVHHTALRPGAGATVDPAQRLRAFDETFLILAGVAALAALAAWYMRPAPAAVEMPPPTP